MTPALGWAFVAALEALLIVLMLPFGFVFAASLPTHQLQVAVLALAGGIGWVAVLRRPSGLPLPVVLAPLPLVPVGATSWEPSGSSCSSPWAPSCWPWRWRGDPGSSWASR